MQSDTRFHAESAAARGWRPAVLAIVLALVLLGASGCGGSGRVTYERDVAKVGRKVDHALERYPAEGSHTATAEETAKLAGDLREAADELDELDPPKDAAKAQVRLVRGLRGVADAYDRLARDLTEARGEEERAERFIEFIADKDVDKAFDDIIAAQDLYDAEGYRVFAHSAPATPAGEDGATDA